MATHAAQSIWDAQIVRRAIVDSFRKLHPRTMARNPVMFVVEIGSVLTTLSLLQHVVTGGGETRLRAADYLLAVADGAVRQFRRGDGRRARQGTGGHAAQGQDGDRRKAREAGRDLRDRAGAGASQGRHRPRRRRGGHSGRRRHHRRRRLGRRERHHRRVRAGHPRVRRRPIGGHRRHEGAVGLDPRQSHRQSRRDLSRSDDRAGGRRRAAEDAE